MALVNTISYSLEDYSGDRRSVRVHCANTLTVAQMTSLSDALAAELDAITGMKILGATVALQIDLPAGLKANPVANCDAERGINWGFNAADTTYKYTIRTPGALDANVDGSDVVSDANVTDWLTVMLDGDAVNEPTNEHGDDLTSDKDSEVTFQK